MNFIQFDRPHKLSLGARDAPSTDAGSALLRIRRVGICGTDLHAFKGEQPYFTYPRIPGHELAAEVEVPAADDHKFKKGDKVVVLPYINCEKCQACLAGKSNCCEKLKVFGVHVDGGMQEMVSYPTRLLMPANDLALDEIALVEPLSIGAHALRRSSVGKGQILLVLGCGPIGMGIIQLGKVLGATVIAVDMNERRLSSAKRDFGADHAMVAAALSPESLKQLMGDLPHVVMDATGNKAAIEKCLDYMRSGGIFVLVGLTKGDLLFHHPSLHAKETTLSSSRNATPTDFEFVMNVLRRGMFNTGAYITRRAEYESIPDQFEAWSRPDSGEIKVMTIW